MHSLREMQQAFLGHLLGQAGDAAGYIQSTPEASSHERLGIYATGYRLRLKEALETDYERLHAYLGDELFGQLMDAYIDRYPSHQTSLRGYGRHMAELLNGLAPFCDVPVLKEIERIERAFNDSFDAADSRPLAADVLTGIPPEAWPTMRLGLHASVRLLPNEYNSFPIWRALSNGQTPPEVERDPATWLVWRKGLVSRYRALPEAEASALETVFSGGDFSALCEGLLDHHAEDEVPRQAVALLQGWIEEEMVDSIICE